MKVINQTETPQYSSPTIVDAGDFSTVTLGSQLVNKVDDTQYWER